MTPKIILKTSLALTIFGLISSCIKPGIEGNHHVISEQRSIDNFVRLESNGDFEVYYSQASNLSLQVSAEENLLPYIYTKVEGNCLVVENRENRNIENHDPIKIFVSGPGLEQIDVNGSGSFDCDSLSMNNIALNLDGSGKMNLNIWAKYLKSKINGSGEMNIGGVCAESDLKISGSGEIRGSNLMQDSCFSTITGSGNISVFVNKLLDVKISGSGSVHYHGNPIIKTHITGSGSISN